MHRRGGGGGGRGGDSSNLTPLAEMALMEDDRVTHPAGQGDQLIRCHLTTQPASFRETSRLETPVSEYEMCALHALGPRVPGVNCGIPSLEGSCPGNKNPTSRQDAKQASGSASHDNMT